MFKLELKLCLLNSWALDLSRFDVKENEHRFPSSSRLINIPLIPHVCGEANQERRNWSGVYKKLLFWGREEGRLIQTLRNEVKSISGLFPGYLVKVERNGIPAVRIWRKLPLYTKQCVGYVHIGKEWKACVMSRVYAKKGSVPLIWSGQRMSNIHK